MMEDDVGANVLMEVEDLEASVMRAHLALQQFIKKKKTEFDLDLDELLVGGVVSLSFSLLPEVRRQLHVVRDYFRNPTTVVKMELDEDEGDNNSFVGPEPEEGEISEDNGIDYDKDPPTGVKDGEGESSDNENEEVQVSSYTGSTPKGKRRRRNRKQSGKNSSDNGSGISEGEDDQMEPLNPKPIWKIRGPNQSKVKVRCTREEDPLPSSTERKAILKSPNSCTPSPNSNSRYTCEKCGKQFQNSRGRLRHLERPPCGVSRVEYKCPHCKKVLSRKDKLKTHMTKIHPTEDEDDY